MAKDDITKQSTPQTEPAGSSPPKPRRTILAIPAYIIAVAALEAFVNELFLSGLGSMGLGLPSGNASGSELSASIESLEKLDLSTKLIQVPKVFLGRTMDSGRQPHQDMTLLTQLRNELVHYKMGEKPPTAVRVLAQRGVAFPVPPEQEEGGPHPWADRVSTLEGIRWAHNTACATALALIDLIPDEKRALLDALRQNFPMIP